MTNQLINQLNQPGDHYLQTDYNSYNIISFDGQNIITIGPAENDYNFTCCFGGATQINISDITHLEYEPHPTGAHGHIGEYIGTHSGIQDTIYIYIRELINQ